MSWWSWAITAVRTSRSRCPVLRIAPSMAASTFGHGATEQAVRLAAEVVAEPQRQQRHGGGLDACVGGDDRCGRGGRFDDADRVADHRAGRVGGGDGSDHGGVHVGQEQRVDDGVGAAVLERDLDCRSVAADQHQVAAGVDRAGIQRGDR